MGKDVERPCDITFRLNGSLYPHRARVKANTQLSVGLTDSERALGFIVSRGDQQLEFVLNKDQVEELVAYLRFISPQLRT
jgi:hypothetical protein